MLKRHLIRFLKGTLREIRGRFSREALLDHLVGLSEELLWDVETQRLGGFEVDDQLECGRLLDRHVRRIGTLEDLSGVNAHQAKGRRKARSIADEAAGPGELTPGVDRRNGMA